MLCECHYVMDSSNHLLEGWWEWWWDGDNASHMSVWTHLLVMCIWWTYFCSVGWPPAQGKGGHWAIEDSNIHERKIGFVTKAIKCISIRLSNTHGHLWIRDSKVSKSQLLRPRGITMWPTQPDKKKKTHFIFYVCSAFWIQNASFQFSRRNTWKVSVIILALS